MFYPCLLRNRSNCTVKWSFRMFIVVVFAYENGKIFLRKVILLAYKYTKTYIVSIPFHSVYILMRWEWEAIACSFNSPNDCIRMRWINWFRTKVDSKPEKYSIVHMVRSTNCQQYRFSLIFNAAMSSQLVSCIQYLSSFYCNKFYIRPSFYLSPLAPFTWMYALKKYVPFVHKHEFHLRY